MCRFVPFALLIAILPSLAVAAPVRAPMASTVYRQGPELHLLPNYGAVGTRVHVYGLGYRPGSRVRIVYGAPNAEFLMGSPLAVATASRRGTFQTNFTVTCDLVIFKANSPARCSLGKGYSVRLVMIGGFVGRSFTHKKTATLGFTVTP